MGGRGSSSGRGTKGGTSSNAGEVGTGIAVEKNGKITNYFVASDGLREIRTASKAPKPKNMTVKEQVKKMLESNNVTFLSKSDVENLHKKYHDDRAKTPDYELGNPFGERGMGKRVYRPRNLYRTKKQK